MISAIVRAAAFAAAFSVAASPAHGRNVVADQEQIRDVLQEAGYRAQLERGEEGRYIISSSGGDTFVVLFYGCDEKDENCKSVQLYAGFDPAISPSLEAMNAYARDNRFGRVYLDNDGDPCIEMDIDLEAGGMSRELFLDNIAYWEAILGGFSEFVFSPPAASTMPSSGGQDAEAANRT
jgi:hypothetical protein